MKRLPFLLLGLMLFCILLGCKSNNSHETGVAQQAEDSAINTGKAVHLLASLLTCYCADIDSATHIEREGHLKDGKFCVFIKYKQQVGGYDVSAICVVDTAYSGWFYMRDNPTAINGHGFIHFKNDDHEFVVENPMFSDGNLSQSKQPLKNGMSIETDYIPFKPANDTLRNMLFDYTQSPFFFFDIDFDGEKELIITLWEGMRYHGHNAFAAYKMPVENASLVLSPMQGEPFDELNGYTRIDTIKKEITQPYDYGMRFGGMKKYGLVTHTVFNEFTRSLEERQSLELIETERFDWQHVEGDCGPTIYHYKKINGDMKLTSIEKCPK